MPEIGTDTVAARVPFRHRNAIDYEARTQGITVNKVVRGIIAAWYDSTHRDEEAPEDEPRALYGVALTLVDDLVAAGYPESEIKSTFQHIRDDML